MKGLLIALSLEYGAYEYLWYSDFQTIDEVLAWWQALKSTDIYLYPLDEIINISQLVKVK